MKVFQSQADWTKAFNSREHNRENGYMHVEAILSLIFVVTICSLLSFIYLVLTEIENEIAMEQGWKNVG